jgi:hypothetical protein
MRHNRTLLERTLLCCLPVVCAAELFATAPKPRTDINPALLYWQAFSIFPEIVKGSKGLGSEWTGDAPGPEDVEFAKRFDSAFVLLRRATTMKAACDWGLDFSDGPRTVLPNLIKVRRAAQAAMLRARVALEEGRQNDAKEDLIAMLCMGHHSARDAALVQVMVQVAIDNLFINFVGAHLQRFTPETLRDLIADLERTIPRVSVAAAVDTEKSAFYEWFLAEVESFRLEYPKDDRKVMERFRASWNEIYSKSADDVIRAAGGTADGLIAYIKQVAPVYGLMKSIATASPEQLGDRTAAVSAALRANPNVIAEQSIPNITRARTKELETISRFAMLQAAMAYRTGGETAFRAVHDPFGDGPFDRRTVDRGFELRSKLAIEGAKSTMTFPE